MVEKWEPVKGHKGRYEVSDLGNIRSLDRRSSDGRSLRGRPVKTHYFSNGYKFFMPCHESKYSSVLVHRAVAEAFLGPSDLDVDHLNGVRDDNRLVNLEFVTRRENILRGLGSDKNGNGLPRGVRKGKHGKHRAMCRDSERQWHIGVFSTADEAHEGYLYAVEHGVHAAREKFMGVKR